MQENSTNPDLLIVSGEASGHLHAYNLAKELKSRRPGLRIAAFGTPRMEEAGCELACDISQLAVMGVKKVLPLLGRFIDVINSFRRQLLTAPPKAVVLIDYPGLNFLLARTARHYGVPVIYYCCPQLWAWAPWRAKKIKKNADELLVIFPFEQPFFAGGHAASMYVGHPLCDELSQLDRTTLRAQVRSEFGIKDTELLLGLFPGSRKQEVAGLGPFMVKAAAQLAEGRPRAHFAFSLLDRENEPLLFGGEEDDGAQKAIETDRLHTFYGSGEPLMAACDAAIVASGTASLELAYFAVPMTVVYPLSKWKQRMFHLLKTTPFISSTNILAGRELVKESLINNEEDFAAVVAEMARLLDRAEAREECAGALRELGRKYLQSGATKRAAAVISRRL